MVVWRAQDQIREVRRQFPWITAEGTAVVISQDGGAAWWSFAAHGANASLVPPLAEPTRSRLTCDSFVLTFESPVPVGDVEQAIGKLRAREVEECRPNIDPAAVEGLKFSECLPLKFAVQVLQVRAQDRGD